MEHYLLLPTTHHPPHIVRQGPQEGTMRERRDGNLQKDSFSCEGCTVKGTERLPRRATFTTMGFWENA